MSPAETAAAERPAVSGALLIARLVLGVIFMAHGSQKLFGTFGGHRLAGLVAFLGWVGYLVAIAEFFGGLGVVLGFLSRFSAFWLAVVMVGAILLVHGKNGFFLGGAKPGFEYNLALIGLALVVFLGGPGRFAIARLLPLPPRVKAWME